MGDLFAVKLLDSLDVVKRDDLPLSLTTMQPDVQKLVTVHLA
jgi:hypothetical protein